MCDLQPRSMILSDLVSLDSKRLHRFLDTEAIPCSLGHSAQREGGWVVKTVANRGMCCLGSILAYIMLHKKLLQYVGV